MSGSAGHSSFLIVRSSVRVCFERVPASWKTHIGEPPAVDRPLAVKTATAPTEMTREKEEEEKEKRGRESRRELAGDDDARATVTFAPFAREGTNTRERARRRISGRRRSDRRGDDVVYIGRLLERSVVRLRRLYVLSIVESISDLSETALEFERSIGPPDYGPSDAKELSFRLGEIFNRTKYSVYELKIEDLRN